MAKPKSLPPARLTQTDAEKIASSYLASEGVEDTGWSDAVYQWDEQDASRSVWRLTRVSSAPPLARTTPWHVWVDDQTGKVVRSGGRGGKPV